MDFQQIRDFVNPAVAQATGLQEVDNLQMPVSVAYVPVQIVIDGALSLTSENPVQNKVIAVAIQNLDGRITAIEGQFSEGVTEAVNNWLAAHPEATTTVQDGAITYAKLDTNLKGEVDQISEVKSAFTTYATLKTVPSGTDLDTVTKVGSYTLGANSVYTNTPFDSGRRTLINFGTAYETGGVRLQVMMEANSGKIAIRPYHDGHFYPWRITDGAGLSAALTGLDTKFTTYATLQTVPSGTDLDTVTPNGFYRLLSNGTYLNSPITPGRIMLFVVGTNYDTVGYGFQIICRSDISEAYIRCRHDGRWDDWNVLGGSTMAYAIGDAPGIKSLDHGGFFKRPDELYQEDSPLAFIRAAKAGISYHNIDIVFSSDGIPIVSHDVTVTDKNGVSVPIQTSTAAEIQAHEFGDDAYSWTPQTLAECNTFIKSLGGKIEMVDVSATNDAQNLVNAGNLPAYYRANGIKPAFTNFDHESHRNAFIAAGSEFGVYMVVDAVGETSSAISYIRSKPDTKFALNIYASIANVRADAEASMATLSELGITLFAYLFNANNYRTVPGWADGVLSETINVGHRLYNYYTLIT